MRNKDVYFTPGHMALVAWYRGEGEDVKIARFLFSGYDRVMEIYEPELLPELAAHLTERPFLAWNDYLDLVLEAV